MKNHVHSIAISRAIKCLSLIGLCVTGACTGFVTGQTELYPGDIMPSMLTAHVSTPGNNSALSGHVGFVVMKDIEGGTTLTIRKDIWQCADGACGWVNQVDPQLMTWTAPAEGVERGTEVIIVDTNGAMEPRTEDQNGWAVNQPGPGNSGNSNALSELIDGDVCGTVTGTPGNYDGSRLWFYQERNGVPHHLYLTGYNLDYATNTAEGTDLHEPGALADCNPVFSFQYVSSVYQWSLKQSYRQSFAVTPGIYGIFGADAGVLITPAMLAQSDYTQFVNNDYLSHTVIQNLGNLDFPPSAVPVTWSATHDQDASYSGSESEDIIVSSSVSNYVVDATAAVNCRNIKIFAGGFQACDGNARTVQPVGNMEIAVGEDNNFNGGMGKMRMNGSTGQQKIDLKNYGNPASTKARFFDLEIGNPAGVEFKGHGRMKAGGALDFTAGMLTLADDPDGTSSGSSSLTFESNALKGTASIGPCSASNFGDGTNQEFTFQRYIPADPDGSTWVNIGAYVTGTTVADWTASNPNMLIFKYNEPNYGSQSAGWSYLWDASTELLPGSGYMAMLPQNQDALISVTGPFAIGDVNIDLTFTDDPNQSNETVDGWNLVSNPYPSPVNLEQVLSRVDGVEAYWIYDNSGDGAYITRNDQGVGDAPSTLDVGQSFWVKVSANQTLTFMESDKVAMANSFIRELDPGFEGAIGLEIANEDAQWCRTFVQFKDGATAAFDPADDTQNYNTTSTQDLRVWTTAESGEKLSIQSVGSLAETPSMPLKITTGEGGIIQFTGYDQDSAPANVCTVIEDTETGERAQLGVDTLTVELPANTQYTDRFILHFTASPSMTWESTACDGLAIELTGETLESWDANWYANDGSATGTGLPYELEDGDYTFEFSLAEAGCLQSLSVTVETACLGDFNLNGERDIVDLLVILAGLPGGTLGSAFSEEADCDCDGAVTVNDMLTFLTVFATACE